MRSLCAIVAILGSLGELSCSALNREGPAVTCLDLEGGKLNACRDGIIAWCDDGKVVTYSVCADQNVCEASWQRAGSFACAFSEGETGAD